MQDYLKETHILIKKEKYKEALEHCIWFHEHALEKEKSIAGVRLSFALSEWKSLADVYPPALTAMLEVRNNKTERILEGNEEPSRLFQDVVALNRTLGECNESIALFEAMTIIHSLSVKNSWTYIKEILFIEKRYDLLEIYLEDPMEEYSKYVEKYNRDTLIYSSIMTTQEQTRSYAENEFVVKCIQLIDYALSIDDEMLAQTIRLKSLAIVDDTRLRSAPVINK